MSQGLPMARQGDRMTSKISNFGTIVVIMCMAASNVKVGAVMERRSMLGFHTSHPRCIGSNPGRAIYCRQKLGGGRINVIAGDCCL